MNRTSLIVLLFFLSGFAASAQTTRQLLDSARQNKSKDFAKVIAFSAKAYTQATADKNVQLQAESAFLKGMGNYLSGQYDECLRWYFESEKLYLKIGYADGLAELYSDMCIFYLRVKKFKDADEVSAKSITYATGLKDKERLPTAVNNRGLMFLDSGKPDSASVYFKRSYKIYKAINSIIGMSYALDYLSSALSEKGKFDEALKAQHESMTLRAGIGDKLGEALAVDNIGEIYLKQNKYREAIPYFLETVKKSHALKYPELESFGYEMLAGAYEKLGMYAEAYKAQKKYLEVKNQLVDAKHSKAIEELQTKYETNKKEAKNKLLTAQSKEQQAELSRNRIGIYALLATIVMGVAIFYLLYNRYRHKQQQRFKDAMLAEQQLRAQGIMDAEENERQRLARELHDGIGQLLCSARRQLEFSYLDNEQTLQDDPALQMLDDSIKEVRDLSHSMMPPYILNKNLKEAIEEFIYRLNNKDLLNIYTEWVNADDLVIDKTTTLMLYRSMQEIISNVFKHAQAKNLHIELINHDKELTLMIIDDGVGFDKDSLMKTSKGLGLKNIESRIAYIGGRVDVDSTPGRGVTYTIELPLTSVA